MSRALDFVVLITAIFGIFTMQMVGGAMLDPLRNEIQEDYQLTDQEVENMNSMFTVIVKWAPTGGLFGLILLIMVREYRRQRQATVRRL